MAHCVDCCSRVRFGFHGVSFGLVLFAPHRPDPRSTAAAHCGVVSGGVLSKGFPLPGIVEERAHWFRGRTKTISHVSAAARAAVVPAVVHSTPIEWKTLLGYSAPKNARTQQKRLMLRLSLKLPCVSFRISY